MDQSVHVLCHHGQKVLLSRICKGKCPLFFAPFPLGLKLGIFGFQDLFQGYFENFGGVGGTIEVTN